MFRRIAESLYERLRHSNQLRTTDRLLREQSIDPPWLDSFDLLQTLLSIKAILNSVPAVLVDVGAHRGIFTRGADKVLKFDRILCVEPDESLLGELERAVPPGKSSIHHLALADFNGECELFIHGDHSMNSLVKADLGTLRREFNTYPIDQIHTQVVKATTLDRFLCEVELEQGADIFLKLDTQGNELNILRGGVKSLERVSACLIEFMFCTPYATSFSFAELVEFMADAGFECKGALNSIRRPTHRISGVDFLFARKSSREFPFESGTDESPL